MSAQRPARPRKPASSSPAVSSRPDSRSGRLRARIFGFLFALLLGALVLLPAAPAQAQAVITPPTNVKFIPGNGQIVLTWTVGTSVSTAAYYDVHYTLASVDDVADDAQRGVGSNYNVNTHWVSVGGDNIPLSTTTLTLPHGGSPAVVNGTTYRVRIRTSYVGSTAWVHGTVTPGTPTAPTGLNVSAGDARLALTWTTVADDAEAGADAATAWKAFSRTGVVATQSVSGLTNDRAYRVRVRAKNTHGSGAWVHGTGTPVKSPPGAPAVYVDKHPTVTTALSVRWDRVAGATAYNMQVRLAGTTSTLSTPSNLGANVGTSTNPHNLTGLTAGTAYEVRVQATTGPWSLWTSGTPGTEANTEWSATLSTGSLNGCHTQSQCASQLSPNTIAVGGATFTFTRMTYSTSNGNLTVQVTPDATPALRALLSSKGGGRRQSALCRIAVAAS